MLIVHTFHVNCIFQQKEKMVISMDFIKSHSFWMQLWSFAHFHPHFWVGLLLHPMENGNGQLTRVAFRINGFLWNPHFSFKNCSDMLWNKKIAVIEKNSSDEILFNVWKTYSFISLPFSKILAEALLNIGVSGEYFVTKIAE